MGEAAAPVGSARCTKAEARIGRVANAKLAEAQRAIAADFGDGSQGSCSGWESPALFLLPVREVSRPVELTAGALRSHAKPSYMPMACDLESAHAPLLTYAHP